MPNKYYPSLKNLITLDAIPDSVDFIKSALTRVFSKIHYKDFQSSVSNDGSVAFYSLSIVTKERLDVDLFFGLKFLLNRDYADPLISSFPVTLQYHWPIIAYLKAFDLQNFSFTPREFYEMGLIVFNISEEQVLAHAINTLVTTSSPSVNPINQFVDDVNVELGTTLTSPISYPTSDNKLQELSIALKEQLGEFGSIAVFLTYILANTDLAATKQKVKTFFEGFIPHDIEEYLLSIIKPEARVTLELAASIEFPRNILKPWINNGSVPDPNSDNKVYFDFAKALLYADTKAGIGYQLELAGTLRPSFAEIGNTGLLIQIESLKLDLSKKTNIPEATADGRPDDFTGVYARALSVTLPAKWFQPDTVAGTVASTMRLGAYDLLIGIGGLSGTIALEVVTSSITATTYYYDNEFEFQYPVKVLQPNAITNFIDEIVVENLSQLKTYLFPTGATSLPLCPLKFPVTLTETLPLTGGTQAFATLSSYQNYLNSLRDNTIGSITPTLWKTIGSSNGFRIGFNKFDITFKQNKIIHSELKASLEIKKFVDSETNLPVLINVVGHLTDKGDFDLTASFVPEYPIELPDVFTYKMRTVSLGKDESQDLFYIGTSGKLQFEGFLKDGLNLKEIDINKLRIYSDGSIEFEGGSIQLAKPIILPLGPVEVTVSAIHYGSHQKEVNGVMRKFNYFGFDGGISIDPLGIEVRGDGIKYYYCTDNLLDKPKPYLHIQTLYVDLTIPASTPVAIINGWLSIPEPGVSPEYQGGIKIKLPKAKIAGGASMKLAPKYPAFIIDAEFDLTVPIPLGSFSIYGFRGLIGYRYIAEKEAIGLVSGVDTWYKYYKAPQRGINVQKFNGPNKTKTTGTPISIGAGASLGTSGDNGTVFNIKAMVILSIPTMFMIDGQASIISARLGLEDTSDPPFYAYVILGDNSLEFGFGADFKLPTKDGSMLDLHGLIDVAFYFNNSSQWHINIGTRTDPIQATVLSLVPLRSFVMLSASGIEAGAGGSFDFEKDYGFIYIHAWAELEIGGRISFERPQFGAYISASCGIDIDLCGIISFDMRLWVLFSVEAPRPFLIKGEIGYSISIDFWLFSVTYSGDVTISWDFNDSKDLSPVNPMINSAATATPALKEAVLKNIVKGVNMLTNEDFDLKLLSTDITTPKIPTGLTPTILDAIIPLDTYIDIKTEKGLLPNSIISSLIGGYNAPAQDYVDMIPPVALVGQTLLRQVKHQYLIDEIQLKFWNKTQWENYNPYKALLPPEGLSPAQYNDYINLTNTLKVGQWQKTDGKYNTIRLMAMTPFSYTEQGEPGWFIPEQYGHTSGSLFCEGSEIENKCADFTTKVLGQEYHTANPVIPFSANEVSFVHLIGNTNEFATVVNEANSFSIPQSLSFKNNTGLLLILPQKSVRVELRLTTFSASVTIQYFSVKQNTEALGYGTFYCNPDPNAINQDAPFEIVKTASQLSIPVLYENPNWRSVSKIVIIPEAPDLGTVNLLREQLAQVQAAKFETNIGLKPSYSDVTVTQYDETIATLTTKLNALVRKGCTEVTAGNTPCVKDDKLCKLYDDINNIFKTCFKDPIKDRNINFATIVPCAEAIIKLIQEFNTQYPNYNLTQLFANQILDLEDFIKNPKIETYTFAWYAVQSILTILFENGDCDCVGGVNPARVGDKPCVKDELICDLYKKINEIFIKCFIDPRTKDIRDFRPMETCAGAIVKLIFDFHKLYPVYQLWTILNPQITILNTFIATPNLLNYVHAWHAVEFILNYLFTLGQCDCVPAGPTVTKCYTLFHNVCWLSVEDYDYNSNIPGQAAIEEDTMATVNALNKFIQPIWRPNTSYYIHIKLRDIVDSTSKNYYYTYGFTTAGPLGFFHSHPNANYGNIPIIKATTIDNVPITSLSGKILNDTKGIVTAINSATPISIPNNTILKLANDTELRIDVDHPLVAHPEKYFLTVLRQYIDYNRSYPNADGNLLGAKPLFYSDDKYTKVSIYFSKAYASHFFQTWPAMGTNGLPEIKGRLKIVIKDPREGTEFKNPPSLDNLVSSTTIPQTEEVWDTNDDNPLMANILNQYNNFTQIGHHCWLDPIEIINPPSKFLSVKIRDLKPSKLYSVIVTNLFDKNIPNEPGYGQLGPIEVGNPPTITQQDETVEVHKYVFQTSRYKNFYEQVFSFKLKQTIDNVVSERDAIFTISVTLSQVQKTAMLNTLIGNPIAVSTEYTASKIEVLKQYQDPFDRIIEGILGLSPINAAISTEFNFIRNTNGPDSNSIIGLLIRNPEPFNDPKIPRVNPVDSPEIPKGILVEQNGFHVLHSKDNSQVLIMHNSTNFPSTLTQLGITFNYITWNGFYYRVGERYITPNTPPSPLYCSASEEFQDHTFKINLDLTQ